LSKTGELPDGHSEVGPHLRGLLLPCRHVAGNPAAHLLSHKVVVRPPWQLCQITGHLDLITLVVVATSQPGKQLPYRRQERSAGRQPLRVYAWTDCPTL